MLRVLMYNIFADRYRCLYGHEVISDVYRHAYVLVIQVMISCFHMYICMSRLVRLFLSKFQASVISVTKFEWFVFSYINIVIFE